VSGLASLFGLRQHPFPGQVLRRVEALNGYEGEIDERVVTDELDLATVVTSEVADSPGDHRPVIDLDFPAKLVPSSTEGHFHLYLDHRITWAKYEALLKALADADVIEPGYAASSIRRGYSAVRLPWVTKPADATTKQGAS
jgi:hypothetical protein